VLIYEVTRGETQVPLSYGPKCTLGTSRSKSESNSSDRRII